MAYINAHIPEGGVHLREACCKRLALLLAKDEDKPLQVYMRDIINASDDSGVDVTNYAQNSWKFAMIVCSIIPILILYPQMQKYFAAGVNLGGVKE